MGYSVERVLKQLGLHKKIYISFILEILIGVILFVSCINIYFSWTDQLNLLKQQRVGKEATVSYSSAEISEELNASANPITYKDYETLSNKYKNDLELSYGCQNFISIALKKNQTMFQFSNFFMADKMYQSIFGSKMESGVIYAGTKAYENIKLLASKLKAKEELFYFEDYFIINEDSTITLKGVGTFNVKPIKNSKNAKMIKHPSEFATEDENFKIEECIILPLHNIVPLEDKLEGWKILKVKYKNSESEINQIPALLADLAKWHGTDYIYTVPDEYMNMESAIGGADVFVLRYFYASICILSIVMIGMIGVMLLFLHQRKKAIAIKIAYGSTWNRIFIELFFELWIVFAIGGAIGLVLSYFILPLLNGAVSEGIVFHMVCIPIILIIMTLGALFVCICSILGMDKTPPAQILKEL